MSETYEGNAVVPLVDDALWAPLERAIRGARRTIELTQLLFETGFAPREEPLADLIEAAARRGVEARILVNENATIPDSYDELRDRFAGTPVEVRRLTMSPNVLHLKLFVVDDEAFLVDAPFEQKYVDTSAHVLSSANRGRAKPLHSVSLHLRGPCVSRIRDVFACLWRATEGGEPRALGPAAVSDARAGGHEVELAWTAPPGLLGPELTLGILHAYEEALGRAKEFVYLENQYLTSPRIVAALESALAREPALEVILVLNVHMDVPTYDTWQAQRLDALREAGGSRVGVFSLWSPRRAAGAALRQLYVHSKVGIVDDAWATVGSANLDNMSLHPADEFVIASPPNVELNAIVRERAWVTDLRRRLWGEHLGDEGVWRTTRPSVADWRAVADENLRRYLAEEPTAGRLFPHGALAKEWRQPLSRAPRGG